MNDIKQPGDFPSQLQDYYFLDKWDGAYALDSMTCEQTWEVIKHLEKSSQKEMGKSPDSNMWRLLKLHADQLAEMVQGAGSG